MPPESDKDESSAESIGPQKGEFIAPVEVTDVDAPLSKAPWPSPVISLVPSAGVGVIHNSPLCALQSEPVAP